MLSRPALVPLKAEPSVPPYDADVERSLLGVMLLHPERVVPEVAPVCKADDFYRPAFANIFDIITELHRRGEPVEPVIVAHELSRHRQPVTLPDLTEMVSEAPAPGSARKLAEIIAEHGVERRALAEAGELKLAAERGSLDEALPGIIERLSGLSAVRSGSPESRRQRRGKIEWAAFWLRDHSALDFLVEPFLARGRSHALYAPGKEGKSRFILPVAAALATGRAALRRGPAEPINVGLLDYEMTEDDVQERLGALGYDEKSDLSCLHYYLLPNLPPLDTPAGGAELAEIIEDDHLDVVFIDTTARALQGSENDADTIRGFYRHTGIVLKRAGVTSLRVDHSGKDLAKGQRGTSAKNDDVDVVWQLSRLETGVRLRATHRRLGWIPEQVDYQEVEDPELRYVPAPVLWPSGTQEVAELLDTHSVPLDATERAASTILREAGNGRRQALVRAALRWRRHRLEECQ